VPCYHPLPAWYAKERNPDTGKRPLVLRPEAGPHERRHAQIPCGSCIGCQLKRASDWAIRCMHETDLHKSSYFLTLTYDEQHLPPGGSLRPKDLQDFLKRLRFHKGPLRFFACGEYGEQLQRPHYHALIWGIDITDAVCYDSTLSTSAEINTLWGHGNVMIGQVTHRSAAYVARYSLKKVIGPAAEAHYQGRHPEFLRMSRRPGIGKGWITKYAPEVYQHDSVIVNGKERKPPRYYDDHLEKHRRLQYRLVKERRRRAAAASIDNTGSRLIVREHVKTSATNLLRRKLEST